MLLLVTYMFVFDGFGEKTDDDGENETDAKEDAAEVEIMDVLDDGRSVIVLLFTTGRYSVGILPDETYHTHH